mmetsp:Transcript_3799/g.6015  ORF Transcript_3799/g.6015 Transcript_3799/m.6015 type:complete len:126 (-) Transcript_3799:2289-2666(-)
MERGSNGGDCLRLIDTEGSERRGLPPCQIKSRRPTEREVNGGDCSWQTAITPPQSNQTAVGRKEVEAEMRRGRRASNDPREVSVRGRERQDSVERGVAQSGDVSDGVLAFAIVETGQESHRRRRR